MRTPKLIEIEVISSGCLKIYVYTLALCHVEKTAHDAMTTPYAIPRMFFYLALLTIAQTAIRPADLITLSDWLFIIALLLAFLELIVRGKLEVPAPSLFVFGFVCLLIGGVISSGFSESSATSFVSLIKYLYLLSLWFWLSTLVIRNIVHVEMAIVCWLLSVVVTSVGAILQIGWVDVIPELGSGEGRMTGFTEHVNDLGGATCIATVPAFMLASKKWSSPWVQFGVMMPFILILIGLILSVSITSIVAAVTSLVIWLYIQRNNMRQYLILVSILLALIFFLLPRLIEYGVVSIVERMTQLMYEGIESITLNTRVETYQVAISSVLENPIVGKGIGSESGTTETGYVVHNMLLGSLYEGGLIFFLGQLLILFAIGYIALNLLKNMKIAKEAAYAKALFASYISFIIISLAQPIYYNRFEWVSAALLFTLNTINERRKYWLQFAA